MFLAVYLVLPLCPTSGEVRTRKIGEGVRFLYLLFSFYVETEIIKYALIFNLLLFYPSLSAGSVFFSSVIGNVLCSFNLGPLTTDLCCHLGGVVCMFALTRCSIASISYVC